MYANKSYSVNNFPSPSYIPDKVVIVD